jgi:hypothetical protein
LTCVVVKQQVKNVNLTKLFSWCKKEHKQRFKYVYGGFRFVVIKKMLFSDIFQRNIFCIFYSWKTWLAGKNILVRQWTIEVRFEIFVKPVFLFCFYSEQLKPNQVCVFCRHYVGRLNKEKNSNSKYQQMTIFLILKIIKISFKLKDKYECWRNFDLTIFIIRVFAKNDIWSMTKVWN